MNRSESAFDDSPVFAQHRHDICDSADRNQFEHFCHHRFRDRPDSGNSKRQLVSDAYSREALKWISVLRKFRVDDKAFRSHIRYIVMIRNKCLNAK